MLAARPEILVLRCETANVAGCIDEYRAFWQQKLDSLKRHLEDN